MARWKRILVTALAAVLLLGAVWWGSGRILPAVRALSVPKEVKMPVLMYHSIHSNPQKAGDYVITPEALERDLQYLQQQGLYPCSYSESRAFSAG